MKRRHILPIATAITLTATGLAGVATHAVGIHQIVVGLCKAYPTTPSIVVGHCGGDGWFSLTESCYSPKTGLFHHYANGAWVPALGGGGSSTANCNSYVAKHPVFKTS